MILLHDQCLNFIFSDISFNFMMCYFMLSVSFLHCSISFLLFSLLFCSKLSPVFVLSDFSSFAFVSSIFYSVPSVQSVLLHASTSNHELFIAFFCFNPLYSVLFLNSTQFYVTPFCILHHRTLFYSIHFLFQSIVFYYNLLYSIPCLPLQYILFYSTLFHPLLYYSALFCSFSFHFILLCSALFCSVLSSVLFYFIHSIPFHSQSILFYSILFNSLFFSNNRFHSILSFGQGILFHYVFLILYIYLTYKISTTFNNWLTDHRLSCAF